MRVTVIAGIMLVVSGASLGAQDPLQAARDLYASAAYEDALSTLSRVDGLSTPELARQAAEYRAFCLYALGRMREAESIAEAIIRQDPTAHLNAPDVSPRLERMFAQVRKRLLPTLVHDRVREARAELDRKRFAAAEPLLAQAQAMVLEARAAGVPDDALADLDFLIDGFRQLIRSEAEQPGRSPQVLADAAAAPVATGRLLWPAPIVRQFYSAEDKAVVPPVALEEAMPALPHDAIMIAQAWKVSGLLRVVIDETGRVTGVTIDRALDASVEAQVLDAAHHWKYLPAIKDGVPVRYIKTIALNP
jgi:tetratricopeptide (TPR) repeat protein